MFKRIFHVIFFTLISSLIFGQEKDIFSDLRLESEVDISLLPKRMVFTQKLFWGENGLLRKTNLSPLNQEQRQKELKLRRVMLKTHQIIGFVTLAGMITQGFLGGKLYKNPNIDRYNTHKTIGNLTSVSYFTGAGLSLFSPPPLINKKYKGLNSIKAHKYLASLHFSAMIATNFFKNKNRKIHKYAAYTAVGSFAAAIMVFKF